MRIFALSHQLAWHVAADGAFAVRELAEADSLALLDRLAPFVIQRERAAASELACAGPAVIVRA